MLEDGEGFYYPVKNEDLCVHCNLCKEVSPNAYKDLLLKPDETFNSKAYMAIHKDENTLFQSASGGAFSALVNAFCKNDFVVFGVEFDENLNAIHSYTKTIQGTEKYRKSKYIQSNINDSYKKAEKFLKEGKKVLFTGTPCQIAGLRLYLRRNYDNMFCVDIICRGLPSQIA
jgi:coenzyme F420-reducing hydrogenase beta subunit